MMKTDLPLELIEQRHPGEWILVEETAWDEYGNSTRGVVIVHSPNRAALVKPTRNVHQQQPGIKTFVFYAGPKIPEGLVVIL
jgi:hypothetical protein